MAAARPPSRAACDDDARQALLAAAHDLLGHEGPAALTVRRIAAAAGMSTMNVYSRFGGKDGVLDELFVDGFRRLGEPMDATPRDATTRSTTSPRAAPATGRSPGRTPTYYSLMFDRVGARLPAVRRGPGRRRWRRWASVAERVERAMDAGALAPGDPFQVAAGAVGVPARPRQPGRPHGRPRTPSTGTSSPRSAATRDGPRLHGTGW